MTTRQKSFSRSLLRSNKFWSLPSDKERLFFMLVILDLDNLGRGLGNKFYLKGKLYEKDPKTTAEHCEKYLETCCKSGLLVLYTIDSNIYIVDPVHGRHNKIVGNMSDESTYPMPPKEVMEKYEQSITTYDGVKQNSSEGKGKGQGEDKGEGKGFAIPTIDEVRQYCQERKNGVNAECWLNHYTANGWMVGKNKMRDWRAAVRTWEKTTASPKRLDFKTEVF